MRAGATILPANDPEALQLAKELLLREQAIVIPTETLFGLTSNATNVETTAALFALKGRDILRPAAIYLADAGSISKYALVESKWAEELIADYLPGPLTVVLKSKVARWPGVVSPEGRIGIRVSSEPFVRELVKRCGRPLLATSANLSGETDCLTLAEIKAKFSSRVPLIVYRQEEVTSQASTVIDLSGSRPRILRPGAINLQERLAGILRED
jgi:L-threonylcarbamoyladenylate synthase